MMQRSFEKTEQEKSPQAVDLDSIIGETLSPDQQCAGCSTPQMKTDKGIKELGKAKPRLFCVGLSQKRCEKTPVPKAEVSVAIQRK